MATSRVTGADVHLLDYLAVLRNHAWLITAIFLVSVFTVAIWTFRQTPVFQAAATVMIEPDVPKVLNIQEVTPIAGGNNDYYQTQYAIIKGRTVLEQVVEAQNLKSRMPALASAAALLGGVTVEPRRGTRLVLVKFEDPNPAVAAEIANAIANSYVKYNLDLKLKGAREALAWLNDQMAELRAKVQESSTALQNYRVRAGILDVGEQRGINTRKIIDFNTQYLSAQAGRLGVEAKLREVTRITKEKSGAQSVFSVVSSPLLERLRTEAAEIEIQRSRLLKTYKEKHPEILKIDAQLQQIRQKYDGEIQTMLRSVQTEYEVARAREESLLRNVNQLKEEAQQLNEKEIQYLSLQRERDSTQQLFEAVLKRVKETGISGAIEANNVRLLEPALVPSSPVWPTPVRSLGLSVVIGLIAGIVAAFGIEYFDTTVRSPEDVQRYLGLPVIGVVPMFGPER